MLKNCNIEVADWFEWLESWDDGQADLIVTDPPYKSLEKHRAVGTTTRLTGKWFPTIANEDLLLPLFHEMYRVLANNSHAYVFVDQETLFDAKPAAESAGFKFWKALVWDKERIGMGYHWRASFEHIMFLEKGKRNLALKNLADVQRCKAPWREYPTQKPAELIARLINNSCPDGGLVMDPFVGAGSTAVACQLAELNASFAGCDIVAETIELARRNVEASRTA